MPRIPIDDLDDPRLSIYRHLKPTNGTRSADAFVVEGPTLVERLLLGPFRTESVVASDRFADRFEPRVPLDVPMYVISHDRVGELVGFHFHRGVLGSGSRTPRPWPDLATTLAASDPRSPVVICPSLDKPDNLGTILRVADAFGVAAVLVGGSCPDELSRRVIRVSMGSAFRVPVYVEPDLRPVAAWLRSALGFELVATVSAGEATPIDRAPRPGRVGLILGHEMHGLDAEWLGMADRRLTIAMRPGTDSLNVGVAAGILLHHVAGDRFSGGPAPGRPGVT